MSEYDTLTDDELRAEFDKKLRTMKWADENEKNQLYQLTEGRLAEIDAEADARDIDLTAGAV
jgi:hypothetical protein